MILRLVFLAIAVCAGPLVAERGALCDELIPHGSSAWKFLTIAATDSVPDGFLTSRAFDESGLNAGTAPFGADSECTCPMPISTTWALGTRLLARHHFQNNISGPAVYTLELAFSGTVRVVFVGGSLGQIALTHEGCTAPGDFVGEFPSGFLPTGDCVVAIVAEGDISPECMTSRFELRLTATAGSTPTAKRSWGTLKSSYR